MLDCGHLDRTHLSPLAPPANPVRASRCKDASTAADYIEAMRLALTQLPGRLRLTTATSNLMCLDMRRRALIRADSGGGALVS